MFKYGEDHLTVSKLLEIAAGNLAAGISPEAVQKIQASYDIVAAIAMDDKVVYGINTGFGVFADKIISKDQTKELQRKILLSHSVGVGKPLTKQLSKIMLVLKVHALSKAYSGIALEVLERILWHLSADVIPVVPEQGSVGASGDLAPLAHLFLPLIGEGKVYYQDQIKPSKEVLQALGKAPLTLGPKAGLALINGTQFIAAHAALLVDRFHNCLTHADVIGAMMVEGLLGSRMPFHSRLHETRPYKANIHVAHKISHLLKDSGIWLVERGKAKVQDPYSLRCIPQVHGTSRTAWLHLKEAVEIEINAVTDNPVIFSKDLTISGGNFHGQPLALPIDYACLAAAEIGNISDRRCYLSLEGKSAGLPKMLMRKSGLNSGFMILQYTSAALVSENKSLCFPASADSIPTSMGQEDHVSMGSISGRKAMTVCHNLEKILAVELLCAAQAFDFRRPLRSSPLMEAVHGYVRSQISFAEEDRIFGDDIAQALQLIQEGKIKEMVNEALAQQHAPFFELFEKY